jgi:hypothetical protein
VGDNPWGAVDLADRLLQLRIQDVAVGDDNDGVEHRLVGLVMQHRQPVGQPGNAVGLAGACRVLDQIPASWPLLTRCLNQIRDCLPLMEASRQTGRARRSQDGSPPYVVRWLVTDHEATMYPGCDAMVVTAAEHTQAAERASARAGRGGT